MDRQIEVQAISLLLLRDGTAVELRWTRDSGDLEHSAEAEVIVAGVCVGSLCDWGDADPDDDTLSNDPQYSAAAYGRLGAAAGGPRASEHILNTNNFLEAVAYAVTDPARAL